jgi:hypothetical protein
LECLDKFNNGVGHASITSCAAPESRFMTPSNTLEAALPVKIRFTSSYEWAEMIRQWASCSCCLYNGVYLSAVTVGTDEMTRRLIHVWTHTKQERKKMHLIAWTTYTGIEKGVGLK